MSNLISKLLIVLCLILFLLSVILGWSYETNTNIATGVLFIGLFILYLLNIGDKKSGTPLEKDLTDNEIDNN